jgi:hypothetical protein
MFCFESAYINSDGSLRAMIRYEDTFTSNQSEIVRYIDDFFDFLGEKSVSGGKMKTPAQHTGTAPIPVLQTKLGFQDFQEFS